MIDEEAGGATQCPGALLCRTWLIGCSNSVRICGPEERSVSFEGLQKDGWTFEVS